MEGPGLGDFNGSSMQMDDDDGADGDDANEEGRWGFRWVEQGREEVGREAGTVGALGFHGLSMGNGLGWEGMGLGLI